ncbi:MAG: discoidin domain-containing protein [Omnitrophica bacterium]|nr:discoidin domain-containing protein [Candidatus Omnitrophota bacterium]
MYSLKNKKGALLIWVFIVIVGLSGMAFAYMTLVRYEIISAGTELWNAQAFYLAEAGLAKARWALTDGEEAVGWGDADVELGGEGTYTVTTADNGDGTYTITSSGYVPDDTNPLAQRRVVEENIGTSSAASNLSLTATASASSAQATFTAANAIDGDSGTQWKSSIANSSWLKLDFGSSKTFDRVVYDGTKIDSFSIEYSANNIAWNPVTNPVEAPAGTVSFDSVSVQYLRFNVNGNKPEINELETYDIAGGGTSLGQGTFITSW